MNRRFRRVVDVVDSFIWWYIPWYRGPMPNDIYPDWRRLRHPHAVVVTRAEPDDERA